ncbi:MAG: hypothetical protein QG670_2890, partial [Thermoproteota archaeon]|nr:hypothetical protein [Thermoproteota archaeon]
MKSTSIMSKQIPAYLMLAMMCLAGIVGVIGVQALSSAPTRTVTTIGGEIFNITGELIVSPQGIGITTTTTPATGTNGSEVVMSASPSSVNTALVQGCFEYRLKVEVAEGGVSNAKEYTVELFADGVSKGTAYIEQGAASIVAD